jgi:DcaP outer membrane protein
MPNYNKGIILLKKSFLITVCMASFILPNCALAQTAEVEKPSFKWGGFIRVNSSFSLYENGDIAQGSAGRDLYVPGTIPVGNGKQTNGMDINAKQSRLYFDVSAPIQGHKVKAYIETDFQTTQGAATERNTNGYTLSIRRAFVAIDKTILGADALIGQEWSNFLQVSALPEAVDFLGPSEGVVFVRQSQARLNYKIAKNTQLAFALENPETATITANSASMIEHDNDIAPDFTTRIFYANPRFETSLSAIARKLVVQEAGIDAQTNGYGVSFTAKANWGAKNQNDVRIMLNNGDGIGRYLGLNFAPDAIYNASTSKLDSVKVNSGFVSTRYFWAQNLRSTLMISAIDADYKSAAASANKSAQSGAINLIYSPIKGLDLGAEIRTGTRKTFDGKKGDISRLEFVAKYSF